MKRSAPALPPLEEVDWVLAVSKIMRVSKRRAAPRLGDGFRGWRTHWDLSRITLMVPSGVPSECTLF